MKRIMLDLETLGTKPGSMILSIGAVVFGHGEITDTFYRRIDVKSCEVFGLSIDAGTVVWWMQQSQEAREEFCRQSLRIDHALEAFSEWLGKDDREIWGNGSDFDNSILAEAYRRCGMQQPWRYSQNRCYRTVKALFPECPMLYTMASHNALNDATMQAQHLMDIFDHQPSLYAR